MIVLDCEQRSPEWEMARLGIPTASRYDDILTPKKLEPSKSAVTYRNQLLAEYVWGAPIEWGRSQFMDRGTNMEPEARAFYEMRHDVTRRSVGFMYRDEGRQTGGSPDSLVGDDGGLEIKCPALHTHIGYLLDPGTLLDAYRSQVQGYLYLSGRAWWDLLSYHPNLPAVEHRILPDPAYLAALDRVLAAFCAELEKAKEILEPYRYEQPGQVAA